MSVPKHEYIDMTSKLRLKTPKATEEPIPKIFDKFYQKVLRIFCDFNGVVYYGDL